MQQYQVEREPRESTPEYVDTRALAHACNCDCRFEEAGWAETPASIELLLLSGNFQVALARLATHSGNLGLKAVVATAYGCRIRERGLPRRVARGKPADRKLA